MTEPLKIIARAAEERARAERALTKWIPLAYQGGATIYAIAKAADITRPAVYQRLWAAGVKERPGRSEPEEVPVAEVVEEITETVISALVANGDGHHPFEAAWNEAGEPLMVCKHCRQWHDAEVHR